RRPRARSPPAICRPQTTSARRAARTPERALARRTRGDDVYASVADLRDEGVSVAQASDARLVALIDEAGRAIDSFTGWFFEPRSLTLRLDGRGTPSIEPPVPPIELTQLLVG